MWCHCWHSRYNGGRIFAIQSQIELSCNFNTKLSTYSMVHLKIYDELFHVRINPLKTWLNFNCLLNNRSILPLKGKYSNQVTNGTASKIYEYMEERIQFSKSFIWCFSLRFRLAEQLRCIHLTSDGFVSRSSPINCREAARLGENWEMSPKGGARTCVRCYLLHLVLLLSVIEPTM